ncbi:Dual-action HEIGH metallo-peptidase [Aquimarina amphilecti]|uniref:Dual-action HEIGH metallo-peptidase n=1 Tax=Aquimarina amphilecti TaxID=1038014 RepID=A0A1H7UH69_AQUAM|nr:M57 family metalloprotease [Aquimarina amphilecti]SEL96400.1 Dual-action HEIGH metallo-peptidase [Aquimarina amphilecti]
MKKIKVLALCAIAAGVITSCQKDEITNDAQPETAALTKAHADALVDAGISKDDAEYYTMEGLPGDAAVQGVKSGDIFVSLSELTSGVHKLGVADDGVNKQYRTNNLVTGSNRSFRVVGYTGSCCALTSKMRTALQWAVNNYNRLNTSLNLSLVFQSNFNNNDMVVYNNGASGGGGSAGFPSGGQAFKRVQINAGTDSFSTNVVEHVMTHEIGHSVGFRHQDWRSRQSCGQNQNEGTAGVGAILINGTPSSDRADSIMLACFGSGEDGEFTSTDVTALNALY